MLTAAAVLNTAALTGPTHARAPLQTAASQPATAVSSQPTTSPRGPLAFQPGVTIDWSERVVRVDGHVVLREGPLEFLACFAGKEHESIVRLDASATHVYMALGLVGLTPGHPPRWNDQADRFDQPTGDLVDLSWEWEQDGRSCTADAFDWLREIEPARVPHSRPWVFAGSQRLPDSTLLADRSGAAVAVVDFSDSLLALSRSRTSRNADLWVEANTPAIPPEGTKVRLAIRPAKPRAQRISIDLRGVVHVDGRDATLLDLVDLLVLARQLDPANVQDILVEGALPADVARLRAALRAAGLPPTALRFLAQPCAPPRDDRHDTNRSPGDR